MKQKYEFWWLGSKIWPDPIHAFTSAHEVDEETRDALIQDAAVKLGVSPDQIEARPYDPAR